MRLSELRKSILKLFPDINQLIKEYFATIFIEPRNSTLNLPKLLDKSRILTDNQLALLFLTNKRHFRL